jgi:hypothetical protein
VSACQALRLRPPRVRACWTGSPLHRSLFARHLCLAVDAKGYAGRDSVAQYDVQRDLPKVLADAAAAAGLDRSRWHIQPQGDEELALLPSDQPDPRVVDDFVRELDACLTLLNFEKRPETRLRVRVAIHFGVAYAAPSGFAGHAVVVTARLLASAALHDALEQAPSADVAVAVSDMVYTDTILQRHTSLRPDQFSRAEVTEKEYTGPAWIRVLSRDRAERDRAEAVDTVRPTPDQRLTPNQQPASPVPPGVQSNFYGEVHADVIGLSYGGRD